MIPSGTVALLFTDVESSVARWEKYGDEMRTAIEAHDAMLRRTIEGAGGYVFKTVGDAFCAAFSTAASAIVAAVEAQRSLIARDWSSVGGLNVRMAVHCGAADLRDGDYFGAAVNRVSRLLSIGRGGQIVVSGIAKELSEGALPSGITLRDLGAHRLRDLAQPEQVYQVLAPDLASVFPALQSLEALPNNLPLQLTPFFGRDSELEQIEAAIDEARLVTLLGAGGVGKTRLSLQAAADMLDGFPSGVWFVDLALLRDGAQVSRAVAEVCNVELDLESEPLDAIVATLRTKRVLLILDNCEHVVEAAAHCAHTILRRCPSVRIIATSRQGLGIGGERIIRVPSLALPPAGSALTASLAGKYGAIALFADRAAAATGSFTLTDENVETVVDVCRRLDGIALAIELAAARLKMLSVQQLSSRLNERFRILTGGNRAALPRQQTMRALIDWSYDLLSDAERALFRRSAVFTGSFSLDAVDAVCSNGATDAWDGFDVLAALVDKSMIASEMYGSEQRYRLLESARQYALERLRESGEEERTRENHAKYYAAFTNDAEHRYFTTPLKLWLAAMDAEAENVRAALDDSMERADFERAAAIAGAFFWYWLHSKQLASPIAMLERIVAPLPQGRASARCYYGLAYLLNQAGDENRSRAAAARALSAAQAAGDRESLAHALVCEAAAAFMDPSYDADAAFERAIDIFGELKNQRMVGITLGRRARSIAVAGDLPAAIVLYERAFAMGRATGDDRTCALALSNLAETAFNTGKPELALRYAGEAVEYATAARFEPLVRVTYANMVIYLLHQGMLEDALDRARIALHLAREVRTSIGISLLALHFAGICAAQGEYEDAAALIGYYLPAFHRIYGPEREFEITEQKLYARIMETLRSNLDSEHLERLLADGAALTPDEILSRMLAV